MHLIKSDTGEILHIIIPSNQQVNGHRLDIVDSNEFLQVALLRLENNQSFPAHIHLEQQKNTNLTQEAWVVIEGYVQVEYFDEEGNFKETIILNQGACSITLRGGHSYKSLGKSVVFEFKTGPYLGIEKDKKFIN